MKKTTMATHVASLVLAALIPLAAMADEPGKHPAYLHALTDLRSARWLISHRPADAKVSGDENVAIAEIDTAINEISKAAIDDGKDVDYHPPRDEPLKRPGRLHEAADVLKKVYGDVAREEDDPRIKGLRQSALFHVDQALHATRKAIQDVEHGA